MSESLWDTKTLGRHIDTGEYSTETLHELRSVLVEEIQGIEAQLARTLSSEFPHPEQFREWKGKAISAKTIKLGQLRQIKKEISVRHAEQTALPLEETIRILVNAVLGCEDITPVESSACATAQAWLDIREGRKNDRSSNNS